MAAATDQGSRGIRGVRHLPEALLWLLLFGLFTTQVRSTGFQEVATWVTWMQRALEVDPVFAFHQDPNAYPPGAVTLLWLTGTVLPFTSPEVAIKILLLVASALTSLAAGMWLRSWPAAWLTLVITGVSGPALGTLDVLYAFPLMLAFWALSRDRFALFSALYAASCLVKWQPLVLAPVLIVYVVRRIRSAQGNTAQIRLALASFGPAAALAALSFIVFDGRYLLQSTMGATSQDMLSGNALNANWLLTAIALGPSEGWGTVEYTYVSDVPGWMPLTARAVFLILTVAVLVLSARARLTFTNLLVSSMTVVIVYGMFAVGAHENHLSLALVPSIALWVLEPRLRTEALLTLVMPVVNVVWFNGFEGKQSPPVFLGQMDSSILGAVLFVTAGGYVLWRSLWWLARERSPRAEMSPLTSG